MKIKIKLIFFSHNKLKFQPRTYKHFFITVLFNDNVNCSDLFNDDVNCSVQCELLCLI